MRTVIAIPAAGVPGTLATTAMSRALYQGLDAIGVQPLVLGLAMHETSWDASMLSGISHSTPWLDLSRRLGDRKRARSCGIFSSRQCGHGVARWRLELALEREFDALEVDARSVLLIDSRSLPILRTLTRVARRRETRTVLLSNEALLDRLIARSTRDAYIRHVVDCIDGVWVVSGHLREFWLKQGVPAKRIHVSPAIVAQESFAARESSVRPGTAVYMGNVSHREIMNLLDIACAVISEVPSFRVAIYADASGSQRRSLSEMITGRGLDGVVEVAPRLAPRQVASALANADVLLMPRASGEFSTAGFPNKLGEYLASGRPVVTTGVGDVSRYLSDQVQAFVVPPDDNQEFAKSVVLALSDRELAGRVGAKGREFAHEHLAPRKVASDVAEFARGLDVVPASQVGPMAGRDLLALMLPDLSVLRRDIVRAVRALGIGRVEGPAK